MPDGVADRSQSFYNGSEAVRNPAFRPVQMQPFQRTSTLDSLMPTGNGMGDQDKQRQMMGIGTSAIGQSQDTFDKSLWLRNPAQQQQATIYAKNYG
jgi:hypothetical protein